jgi:hypothetical protein
MVEMLVSLCQINSISEQPIAFATVYYLYALFATHFHELADMVGYVEGSVSKGYFENVDFFCTDVALTA